MSSDAEIILEVIPRGKGNVLDLGGSKGMLRQPLQDRGYHYINVDIRQFAIAEPSLLGDAHRLPFRDMTLDMVVSKDTLEHFIDPWQVVEEVHRVLKEKGKFIILVPFMHPFHGDDYYRYSPLGLQYLLQDFEIVIFESPAWVCSVIGLAFIEVLKRIGMGRLGKLIKYSSGWLDRRLARKPSRPASFAAAYRIVALKSRNSRT